LADFIFSPCLKAPRFSSGKKEDAVQIKSPVTPYQEQRGFGGDADLNPHEV
jgi:hypothetical protein